MFNLENVFFGCADASTEAERFPSNFKKSFFDPHDYIEELVQ